MSYNTKIITLEQALHDHAVDWQLLLEAEALEPTQMPEWLNAICKAFEVGHLVEVWCAIDQKDQLVSVIPFQRKQTSVYGLPLKTIELTTNIISYHAIPLGAGAQPELFILFLQTIGDWDLCITPNLVIEDPSYPQLLEQLNTQSHSVQSIPNTASPYLTISTDWDSYLASRSRSFRYRLQRKAKTVAKAGEISVRWYSDEFDIDQLLEEILQIEANSWKVEAGMAISHRPVEQHYYEQLLPLMATNGLLMANVLYIDTKPVAYGLCYNFKQCWGQLKTSFDDHYKQYSPGTHLVDLSVEQAFKEGAREFDFLGDRMRHKLEWTDQVRSHHNLYIYNTNSLRGKLAGLVKKLAGFIKSKQLSNKKTTDS
ncbi:MAG: GNAT family N-acetyltransferase [Methylococcales bacterium]